MAQVLTPGLSLNIPTSRQDVVSALLNDYGTSFGQGDQISHDFPPAPALKELPPTPPSNSERPLPPALSTPFPLREEPTSPDGSVTSPTQIASRSISRNSKPRSLKLMKSNGSTAVVVSSPTPEVPSKKTPVASASQPYAKRPLPPPPQKSELPNLERQPGLPDIMGQKSSKVDRKASKESQEVAASVQVTLKSDSPQAAEPTQTTKRRPLPIATISRKFASFADLKKGLRGRASSTTSSADSDKTVTQSHSRGSSRTITLASFRPRKDSLPAQLPPTPDDEPVTDASAPLPPPPRKAYGGLPSNPRPTQQDAPKPNPPVHSNIVFGVPQSFKPSYNLQTITPERTPSPRKQETVVTELSRTTSPPDPTVNVAVHPQSPVSPLRSGNSYMRRAAPKPEPRVPQQHAPPTMTADTKGPQPSAPQAHFPPRTSSRPAPQPPQADLTPVPVPSHHIADEDQEANDDDGSSIISQGNPGKPPRVAEQRPITSKQLDCYTSHAHLTEYRSYVQTPSCMVCGTTEGKYRCTCSWCVLQICTGCRDKLCSVPGRNLQVLLDSRKKN